MLYALCLFVGFFLGAVRPRGETQERAEAFVQKHPLTKEEVAEIKKPMGFVVMPETEHDMARERVLARNKELGVDTPLEDLT